jgi:hypothetical protein
MYMGATLSFGGSALMAGSAAGLLLTVWVYIGKKKKKKIKKKKKKKKNLTSSHNVHGVNTLLSDSHIAALIVLQQSLDFSASSSPLRQKKEKKEKKRKKRSNSLAAFNFGRSKNSPCWATPRTCWRESSSP